MTVAADLEETPEVLPPPRPVRAMPTGEPALPVSGLVHRHWDGTLALSGIDRDFAQGSVTAIAGHDGSGKSIPVRHVVGLRRPTAGEARRHGLNLADTTVGGLRVGSGSSRGTPTESSSTRASRRRSASRSRCSASLALDPPVLIFDESTTGQDLCGARAIIDVLRRLQARGRTVILIMHHLHPLGRLVNRLVIPKVGRVHPGGSPEEELYAGAALGKAGAISPQTVRLSARMDGLTAARPLRPDDLEHLA